mmetsp:Transcript_7737/g.23584  ORF Transcript_7737/g.23584 Transcript_7737/m.23584 type:complete len:236 (-) Transcript_7737:853-1560(-)
MPRRSLRAALVLGAGGLVAALVPGSWRKTERCGPRLQHPPSQSPYVQPDEEQTLNRFNEYPETYVPDPRYPGTSPPGAGPDNAPLSELPLTVMHNDIGFYEVPFHLRWPLNHPWLKGPYERLEIAGRFVDGDEIERRNRKSRGEPEPQIEKVQKLDKLGRAENEDRGEPADRDPRFDDQSSSLLDAALGLGETPKKNPSSSSRNKSPQGSQRLAADDDDDDDDFDAQEPGNFLLD